MRRLPMRRARSACPTVLLILWAPVWFRSSRLSSTGAPISAENRGATEIGEGRPTNSANNASSSAQNPASVLAVS
jgi:hypothetical protein